MEKITEILKKKYFTMSIELVPPRNGEPIETLYENLEKLRGKVDFVSVTKGAGGSLRGGTLPISYLTKTKFGIDTIAHFVCRERTKYEIENELIDLYYFNIKNILALRGDPPAGSKEAWNGDYKYAYLLVEQIKNLNNGRYLPRINVDKEFRDGIKTDFCIIVAGHPEDPIEEELQHLKAKVDAGAEVIITQMIFSFEDYRNYVEKIRKKGITLPIIPGIRPIVNYKQALSVENFFNVPVADELKEGLKDKDEEKAKKFGISYTTKMIKKLKEYGAPGVHLFLLNDVWILDELLKLI
jgi:methylenetetrahydrofolate reductase (NADPH)